MVGLFTCRHVSRNGCQPPEEEEFQEMGRLRCWDGEKECLFFLKLFLPRPSTCLPVAREETQTACLEALLTVQLLVGCGRRLKKILR